MGGIRPKAAAAALALCLGVPLLASPRAAARGGATASAPRAGIDVGSVVEKVRHHVSPTPTGALEASDPLYRACFDGAGFAMSLPSGAQPALSVSTSRVGAASVSPASWRGDYNAALRSVAPGVTERVTALDGALEWDFVLDRPPSGSLRIEALVAAAGPAEVVAGTALRWPSDAGRGVTMGELVVKDSRGREIYRALPRTRGSSLVLEVPERVLAAAAYPVTVDPRISPTVEVDDDVTYLPALFSQTGAVVASNGTLFLVVWEDRRYTGTDSGGRDVVGARVSAAGAVLDRVGVLITPYYDNELSLSVAWNGTDFLVAWQAGDPGAYDVRAARVHADEDEMRVLDPDGIGVATATGDQTSPAVASDGASFLVVWEDAREVPADLYGAFVAASGAVGAELRIADTDRDGLRPAVAWNGSTYLVAWQQLAQAGDHDLYALTVSPQGVTGEWITVSGGWLDEHSPAVASDGVDFLVVWRAGPAGGGEGDIHGARVTGAGVVAGPGSQADKLRLAGFTTTASGIPIAAAPGDQSDPRVAWGGAAPGAGAFLVAWTDTRPGAEPDVSAARVSGAGVRLEPDDIPIARGAPAQSTPGVGFAGDGFLVGWQEPGFGADLYGSLVPLAGPPQPSRFLLASGANEQLYPAVAWSGSEFLVVWSDLRDGVDYDVYGARVGPLGNILDASAIPIARAPGPQLFPSVAWGGGAFLVSWFDYGSDEDVMGARVLGNGTVVDANGFLISRTELDDFPDTGPAVAFNGTSFLVAWLDARTGSDDIFGTLVSPSGIVLSPGGTAISAAPDVQRRPSVASDGSGFLVAWEDGRSSALGCPPTSGCYDIYAARVAPTGVVQDPAGIPVRAEAVNPVNQGAPEVASSGPGIYLVAWEHERAPDDWVLAGAVVSSGAPVPNPPMIDYGFRPAVRVGPSLAFNGRYFLLAWTDYSGQLLGARVGPSGQSLDASPFLLSVPYASGHPALARGPGGRIAVLYTRSSIQSGGSGRIALSLFDDPPNDAFADAAVVSGQAGSAGGFSGGATREPGEPAHGGEPRGASLWFRWTAPVSGGVEFLTEGTNFDTVLAAYTGADVASLQPLASDNDSGPGTDSRIAFHAGAGVVYQIAVDGVGGATGNFTLRWNQNDGAPETILAGGPEDFTAFRDARFEFSATSAVAGFNCTLDGGTSACTSPKEYRLLPDGPHTFAVAALGDPTPQLRTWTIDTSEPVLSFTGPAPGVHADGMHVPLPAGPPILVGPKKVCASATDSGSGISSVAFEVNGRPATDGHREDDLYCFTYRTASPADDTISARAVNRAGLGTAASLQVIGVP